MTAYYILLLGLTVLGALLCFFKRSRTKDGIFLLVSFVTLAAMSAMRYDVGFDYSYIYAPIYHNMLIDPTGDALAQSPWEPGFNLLLRIIMTVSFNYQTIFVVTSLLFIGLVMLYFWLFSPNPAISVFLFITLSHFYGSMNFVRQSLAAAIAMFAFPLLKKLLEMWDEGDDDIKMYVAYSIGYFGIVLIASTFHMSALLLVPFFFINIIPINKFVLPLYAIITASIFFTTYAILELVTRFWYTQYHPDNIHMQVGFSPQFAIAALGVFVLLFVFIELLKKAEPSSRLYVNYAYFAFFFVLIGIRHSVLDRLSLNFILLLPVGLAIVVSALFKSFKEAKSRHTIRKNFATLAIVLFAIVGGGLSIHHYALTMDHHGVVPYQIVFNQEFYRDYVAHLRTVRLGLQEPILRESEPQMIELPRPVILHQGSTIIQRVPYPNENRPFEISLEEFIRYINMEE